VLIRRVVNVFLLIGERMTISIEANFVLKLQHYLLKHSQLVVFARELLNQWSKLRSIAGPHQHKARYVGYFHYFLRSFMHHLYAAALLALLVAIRIESQLPHCINIRINICIRWSVMLFT